MSIVFDNNPTKNNKKHTHTYIYKHYPTVSTHTFILYKGQDKTCSLRLRGFSRPGDSSGRDSKRSCESLLGKQHPLDPEFIILNSCPTFLELRGQILVLLAGCYRGGVYLFELLNLGVEGSHRDDVAVQVLVEAVVFGGS